MKFNPNKHHRRSIRLKNYDYSREGAYFITICTKERECFFGKISAGKLILNDIGTIAERYLKEIPDHFPHVDMGEMIVMPNHIHCILVFKSYPAVVGARHVVPLQRQNQFSKPFTGSVSVVIQQFKSSVKRWCNQNDHKYFHWQSRFYDHIIRDDKSFQRIVNYIKSNPSKWNK
jgi:REP element-mobilizing transposase RayT